MGNHHFDGPGVPLRLLVYIILQSIFTHTVKQSVSLTSSSSVMFKMVQNAQVVYGYTRYTCAIK
jgi:hypothetical protein